MVVKFTFQSVFGNSLQNPRHFSARGREESLELYSILWSDWPTSKQEVLRHGNRFAARVRGRYFRRERSDDRKCVCCSQATHSHEFRERHVIHVYWTGNGPEWHRCFVGINFLRGNNHIAWPKSPKYIFTERLAISLTYSSFGFKLGVFPLIIPNR